MSQKPRKGPGAWHPDYTSPGLLPISKKYFHLLDARKGTFSNIVDILLYWKEYLKPTTDLKETFKLFILLEWIKVPLWLKKMCHRVHEWN